MLFQSYECYPEFLSSFPVACKWLKLLHALADVIDVKMLDARVSNGTEFTYQQDANKSRIGTSVRR